MTTPTTDEEFQSLMPPVSNDEYAQLETNILADGCREPLSLWDSLVLDGHNRLKICQEHGLDFTTVQIATVTNRAEAVNWIVNNQLGRRNLTPLQISYLRGKRYEQEKKQPHAPSGKRVEKVAKSSTFSNTAQKVADEHNVSSKTIRNDAQFTRAVDALADIAGDDVRTSILQHDAPVTRQDVKQIAKDVKNKPKKDAAQHIMSVMGSSASPEWYTPQRIIDLTLNLFGAIDTDPCSNSKDKPNVPAELLYTKKDDGLAQTWRGRVYMNPPYGREIPQWVETLLTKYQDKEISEAILLLPGRIDTRWFQPLYNFLICCIHGRLNYPQSPSATPFPSVIVYVGKNKERFVEVFRELGPILKRIDQNEL